MLDSSSPELLAQIREAASPLDAFGFLPATLTRHHDDLGREHTVRAICQNTILEIQFCTEMFDFHVRSFFLLDWRRNGLISEVAPIWQPIENNPLVTTARLQTEYEKLFPLNPIAFNYPCHLDQLPHYIGRWCRALAEDAADILSGDLSRVRALQIEHFKTMVADIQSRGDEPWVLSEEVLRAVDYVPLSKQPPAKKTSRWLSILGPWRRRKP